MEYFENVKIGDKVYNTYYDEYGIVDMFREPYKYSQEEDKPFIIVVKYYNENNNNNKPLNLFDKRGYSYSMRSTQTLFYANDQRLNVSKYKILKLMKQMGYEI